MQIFHIEMRAIREQPAAMDNGDGILLQIREAQKRGIFSFHMRFDK